MTINSLSSKLSSENILRLADDDLVRCGGIPHGLDQRVNDFIIALSNVLVQKSESKLPTDFYRASITVQSPQEQIDENVSAFAQGIIRRQQPIIKGFQGDSSQLDYETLVEVSRAIILGLTLATAEHFVEEYNHSSKG